MEIRVASSGERDFFFARHMPVTSLLGLRRRCSCGWSGADWSEHMDAALAAWREERRHALRARL